MEQLNREWDRRPHVTGKAIDEHGALLDTGSLMSISSTLWPVDPCCLHTATLLLAQRQKRLNYFSNASMFGEPSWDILLFLFVIQAEARPASLAELSGAARCAKSTALRWLNVLSEEGLVRLLDHSEHLPDLTFALSARGHAIMTSYLTDVSADNNL